jgi:hypothetical protein
MERLQMTGSKVEFFKWTHKRTIKELRITTREWKKCRSMGTYAGTREKFK